MLLIDLSDTSQKAMAISGEKGFFVVEGLKNGSYRLETRYIGYLSNQKKIELKDENQRVGTLLLEINTRELETVKIEGQLGAKQKADTTEYNAASYKTNPDATAEDIVAKMPGVTKESGTIKAQGEDVKRVTVDGQEFFGDDASLALKNLPAEVIEKIQIFDRMSDQSQFTGFNDGNTEKTMNIVTKSGMKNGTFGKIYGSYGTDDRYSGGGNLNVFKGSRKFTIIGLTNNINQQNFSSQDLLGLSGSSGQRSYGGYSGSGSYGGMGGSGQSDFLIGQQSGISTTNSFGINYSDMWGKKWTTTGSYFFNSSDNDNNSSLERQYFISDGNSQFYKQNNEAESDNLNHRINLRLQFNPDTSNSFILTPKLSFQNNKSNNIISGQTTLGTVTLLSSLFTNNKSENQGYSFSNNLMYRHKFKTDRRTISFGITTNINDKAGTGRLFSENRFQTTPDSFLTVDQQTNTVSDGTTWSGSIFYTEPIGKKGMLMINYSPSLNLNQSDKRTNMIDVMGTYTEVSQNLSGEFENKTWIQKGGMSYRFRADKFNLMMGFNYQHLELTGKQLFPYAFTIKKPFDNILPIAMFQYTFSKSSNIRIFYRTSTNVPSINQLQKVIDNSNTQLLTSGNPDLEQEYSHTLVTRFGKTNASKMRSLFAFLSGGSTANYIGNSAFIADSNTVLANGVVLKRGSQLSKPVNQNGQWNLRSFVTYGIPVKKIKCNLNINVGFNYSRTPGQVNNATNISNNYNMNGGLVLSSNISQKTDFTLAYTNNYSIVKNSIQPLLDNNFVSHIAGAKINWLPWKGLVLTSDITFTKYTGLASAFNQGIMFWNGGIGYKFLKNRLAEIRLTGYDLLKKNNSIARTVTETYIEDNQTQVLQRYFLLTFTYNIRKFGVKPTIQKPSDQK